MTSLTITDETPGEERYARWILQHKRLPAALKIDFDEFMPKLFCTYEGQRWEVIFVSRLGPIQIENGEHRLDVDVADCSEWSGEK